MNLAEHRIVVTGGAGFLGKFLQEDLLSRGAKRENLFVPLIEDYDLTRRNDVAKMYSDMTPSVVIHLAAEVGGIGANRENPGRFFYANMAMGLHLIEQARIVGLEKFVQVEVDVTIFHNDIKKNAPINYDFTFIREGGKWYKG